MAANNNNNKTTTITTTTTTTKGNMCTGVYAHSHTRKHARRRMYNRAGMHAPPPSPAKFHTNARART